MYISLYIPKYYILHIRRYDVVNNTKVKIYASKSRHSINLPSEFVRDSAFPFQIGETLTAKIEGKKIIIEKD
jgi:hypothetical protein